MASMRRTKAALAVLLLGTLAGSLRADDTSFDWDIWKPIVVLDGGRTKPMDTLAWEAIYAFAGRSKITPAHFGVISIVDIPDWRKFADKVLELSQSSPETFAQPLSADLRKRLEEAHFDTAAEEQEYLSLVRELDERLLDYAKRTGVEQTMRQFKRDATDEEDRKAIARLDELSARLDEVGKTKSQLLLWLNEQLPDRRGVSESHLQKVAGERPTEALSAEEVAWAHRRQLEETFGDALTPMSESMSPIGQIETRKHGPLELMIRLALTWRGLEDLEATSKIVERAGDAPPQQFASRLWMSMNAFDAWDALPMVDARYQDLAPRLIPEVVNLVSPRTLRANEWFFAWAERAERLQRDKSRKGDLATADEKAVDVERSLFAYAMLRTGHNILIGPDQTVKPRVAFIREHMRELESELAGVPSSGAAPKIDAFKARVTASAEANVAADVIDIADRVGKELAVQEFAKSPIPAAVLIEQQTRVRCEEIANEVKWLSVLDLLANPKKVAEQGYSEDQASKVKGLLLDARAGLLANDPAKFNAASRDLVATLATLGGASEIYPPDSQVTMELHYNRFQPFLWTAVIAGISLILLVLSLGLSGSGVYVAGFAILMAAVGMMGYGMGLRIAISGRPPVTNMYETIIWASFIMALLAMTIGAIYRSRLVVTTAAMTLTPATLLAYVMPPEYGASIDPLVPVLRDNFWLIIHVLTIVASYGAFMLAWMLGNVGLAYYLSGNDQSNEVKPVALYIYRAIQVGVLLLAAGTILGGWWAAYSWGRFWGWDPKEVWALIALLGYLALLHARFAGLVKTFGLIVCSVLAFAGVVMSWYGVNFVLGEGLHAYAFGSGGQPYVATAIAVNIGYVLLVAVVHRARKIARHQAAVATVEHREPAVSMS